MSYKLLCLNFSFYVVCRWWLLTNLYLIGFLIVKIYLTFFHIFNLMQPMPEKRAIFTWKHILDLYFQVKRDIVFSRYQVFCISMRIHLKIIFRNHIVIFFNKLEILHENKNWRISKLLMEIFALSPGNLTKYFFYLLILTWLA